MIMRVQTVCEVILPDNDSQSSISALDYSDWRAAIHNVYICKAY